MSRGKKGPSRAVQGKLNTPGDEQYDPDTRVPPRLKRRLEPHLALVLAQVDATNAVIADRTEIGAMMKEEGLLKVRLPNDAFLVHKHTEDDKIVYEPPKKAKEKKTKKTKDKKKGAEIVGPDTL